MKSFWYIICRIRPFKRKIKYLVFYLRYGFSPHECWNLDYTISAFILPRLKYYRKYIIGIPCDITDNEWKEYLDKMIWSFEYSLKDYENGQYTNGFNRELHEENGAKFDEGMQLFAKYYGGLWN